MRKWKGWGATLALAASMAGPASAATQPSEEQVRQLMEVVGVGKMLSQMNNQAVTVMQQSLPCIPASYWQGYMDANGTQQFIGRLVPIYQRHFSADEIDGMLKFYRSPLGQKVITEMPTTMGEANQAGLQWSKERSDQMIAELKQKGSLDASGRCPAAPGAVAAGGAAAAGLAAGASKAEADDEDEAQAEAPAKPAAKKAATGKAKSTKAKPKAKAPAKPAAKKAPAKSSSAKTPAQPAAKDAAKPAAPAAGGGGQ
ncbi:hypothetical protein SAMN02799615_01547 [Dyella marensis]|uniref:DUF2059 domain-containing protein n=2 Tax=Rhodanobacteraceae TaxID=1775411 RepID=A0A1I2CMV7_9GAMM|nr:hypothetical protein SAMN02799615_01547 [Dyella marensis]